MVIDLNKRYFSSTNNGWCQTWLTLVKWFCRNCQKYKMFKNKRTDRRTNARQKVVKKAHLSS